MRIRILAAIGACWFGSHIQAQVAPPPLINYQGRVLSGSTNFDGTGQFKFALVSGDGASSYWSNDGTSANGSEPTNAVPVAVVNGLYSVLLGDTSLSNMTAVPASVFSNSDVRLRIWFSDGSHGSELLTPDQRIASVGYAMLADNVKDGAIDSTKLAAGAVKSGNIDLGAVGTQQLGSTAVQTANIGSGAVTNAKLANPSVTLNVSGGLTGGGAASLGSSVNVGTNATSSNVASTIASRGTDGSFSAGAIGIGTGTPLDSILEVNGNIHLDDKDFFLRFGSTTDHNHGLGYYGAGKTFAGQAIDGPVLYGFSGGALGTRQSATQTIALRWDAAGKVTTTGDASVGGNLTVTGRVNSSVPNLKVRQTAVQTLANGAVPTVRLDEIQFGSGITFDNANDTVVIVTPGVYQITGEVLFVPNGTGVRFLAINSNNGGELSSVSGNAVTGGLESLLNVTTMTRLNAGDTVFLSAAQISGGNLNTEVFSGKSASLALLWVAP